MKFLVCASGVLLVVAAVATATSPGLPAAERKAAEAIREAGLRADTRFLASDALEGRGPGTRGDQLAREYIAARFEAIGLRPAGPDGSWFQPVELVAVDSDCPAELELRHGGQRIGLRLREEYVAFSGVQREDAGVEDAEVVFVGYGIVAPEYDWDDFKDVDVRGKVLLILNNDPEDDPKLFEGRRRLYYGRWDYKFGMAARRGAAGAIILHTDHSAGYKWQVVQSSWSGEQLSLPLAGQPTVEVKAWVTEEAGARLAKLGGHDLAALVAQAQGRAFRPVPLGVRLSIALQNSVSRRSTANVIGRWPGGDPALRDEAVLYTAHHDHLGMKKDATGQPVPHNGALDNASGVATLLAVAEAFAALPAPPRRSVLFAAVAAEEQGLLGSEALARNPPLPPGRIAANLNVDGMNIWGRTRDVRVVGLGKSTLDDDIRAIAAAQDRVVVPEAFPDKGSYYRSDHFSLARIGVPAAYLDAGTDVRGKPPEWGRERQEAWEAAHYHQPSDDLQPDWDFSGAIEDARLLFHLGARVAQATQAPSWRPGDEFEAARREALAALRAR